MGWTDLRVVGPSPLWNDMPEEPRFYFAHSYHFVFDIDDLVTGKCNYGYEFPCAFRKENIFGVQFHPEKSHKYGMKILSNFASL
jgi:glutamine amidotransferase